MLLLLFYCVLLSLCSLFFFFFSSRRRHTRSTRDWSSDVCSSDLSPLPVPVGVRRRALAEQRLPRRARRHFHFRAAPGADDDLPLARPARQAEPEIGRASCRKECRSRWWP